MQRGREEMKSLNRTLKKIKQKQGNIFLLRYKKRFMICKTKITLEPHNILPYFYSILK